MYFEQIQESFSEEAKNKGLYPEEYKVKFLIENNLWTKSKESDIENSKNFISNLEESKKKQILPSAIKQFDDQIKNEQERLNKILEEKYSLIGMTIESYSQRMVNDYYIKNNIYKDKKFEELLFTDEEFNNLDEEEVAEIIFIYNKVMSSFSDDLLKKLSLQDFFQSYYYLCNDNIKDFFGKPIINLTFNQIKVANFAKYYKSLLENTDSSKIPKESRYDPDKLENYLTAKRESEKALDGSKDSAAQSLVGATNEDLKELGLEKDVVKFPNKPMNKDELMKFLGAS